MGSAGSTLPAEPENCLASGRAGVKLGFDRSKRCGKNSSKPADSCWAPTGAAAPYIAKGSLGFIAGVVNWEDKICLVFHLHHGELPTKRSE